MKNRAFCNLALVVLACPTIAFAQGIGAAGLDWKQLMGMDPGQTMNEMQRVANVISNRGFMRDSQGVFDSIFGVYSAATKLEGRFPYDKSKDNDFRFEPTWTPMGMPPAIDWSELEKANVRTAINALWDVACNVQFTNPGNLAFQQLPLFMRLSNQYFQMKGLGQTRGE